MEAGEETSGSINLKRQRAPLSDSEDNVVSSSEGNEGLKRRRLEAAGQENRSPKPSSSRRLAELETKPDTPIVPSVRTRVQQLTQRRDGGAPLPQRCLSDPGADSPSVLNENGFRGHLLSEGEFNQRMERFKEPVFQASPAPTKSPPNPSPRPSSNFVSDIQQKLQCTATPSSQQASRMREERRQELSRLQPISENAWLKRSSSDPSLTQADDDTEMKDGSFTEIAETQSADGNGNQSTLCDSGTQATSVELGNSAEGRLPMKPKEDNAPRCEEVGVEKGHKASFGNEGSQQSTITQTVIELSFSEEQSLPESTHPQESSKAETGEVSKEAEHGRSEVFSFEEINPCSDSEEEIEPSTDEELRLWRYPQAKGCKEEGSVAAEEQKADVCFKEGGGSKFSREDEEKGGVVGKVHTDIQDGECCLAYVSAEISGCSEVQEDERNRPEEDKLESESCLKDSVEEQSALNGYHSSVYKGALTGDVDPFTNKSDQEDVDGCTHGDEIHQQSKESGAVSVREGGDLESDRKDADGKVKLTEEAAQALKETQTEDTEHGTSIDDVAKVNLEAQAESSSTDESDGAQELEQHVANEMQGGKEGPTGDTHKAEGGESSKKVTFILEPEFINDCTLSASDTSMESTAEGHMSDAELGSHDETNTAEIIDQMFGEVLEYAGRMEQERAENDGDTEDHDSGIATCLSDKDKMETESEKEKEKSEDEGEAKEEECDDGKKLESNGDELLTFPPSGILSPLSKSVEAVVTPLRLTVSQESNPPSLLLTPDETSTPPAESAPLYSVDAYRTQRQSKKPAIQSVTPGVQRRAPQKSQPPTSVNTKEKITALNEEAAKLQTVINQTLQALSCCTDEEHGRGSLEEAEAEKLLLVSCEKRSALLAEVTRLREERNSESAGDQDCNSQQPCRGTVSITNIQLPLKVEFVCSSHNRPGRPSHYFFVLIRYGPCNIVATPLVTAADAQNGDTISFPTSVTLKDIRSSFEIDVEVYSLSHASAGSCSTDRTATKSRVTPRKLLNTITRSNNSLAPAAPSALVTRRSSNFCLVGSHKITLASLGHSKFPLDKMKLEGKIRRLLGDEFQEKVPFLSPLEGNIYLRLDSKSHSNIQHQGFLTMFELISGYGVWHRRYFVLEGYSMYYWNHPNDKETKEAEGSISLSSSPRQSVRPVKRDSCARPFTFELVSTNAQQQQDGSQDVLSKCWFSADTKQERLDWMEKLSQALLDLHTWNQTSATRAESQQSNLSGGGNMRESIL